MELATEGLVFGAEKEDWGWWGGNWGKRKKARARERDQRRKRTSWIARERGSRLEIKESERG